jgi:hypothetical protein
VEVVGLQLLKENKAVVVVLVVAGAVPHQYFNSQDGIMAMVTVAHMILQVDLCSL